MGNYALAKSRTNPKKQTRSQILINKKLGLEIFFLGLFIGIKIVAITF